MCHCERSEAISWLRHRPYEIASALTGLAMTGSQAGPQDRFGGALTDVIEIKKKAGSRPAFSSSLFSFRDLFREVFPEV